ncbi:bifunctional transcriptional activator/DNA repair enzyme AdaA [Paenibacillus massiliensis]|uniref:bifunctional transcriptional activator/DNA repair enzyme AdaA n=1 Tax=Paenibacillus massiliensis TaxID=225917 RepID=UPI00046FB24E|nr:Ada metal-binding domain-containing protein [Paenibacillus massiliensis]
MREAVLSFEEMWERIMACDRHYDGIFYTAVKTTRIYCRPSCRSRKPKKMNVEFYPNMQQAEQAGYRACKRCQPDQADSPSVTLVRQASAFLIQNYKRRLLLEDVAAHVGVSPFYLDRVFKLETDETPRTFLEQIRIDKAAYLLRHTQRSNLEIGYDCGFQSTSHFYKAFRRLKHCSPGEYRRNSNECNPSLMD